MKPIIPTIISIIIVGLFKNVKKSVEVFNNPKIFTKTIEEIIAQNRIIVNN